MCLKPVPPRPIPEATAALVKALFPEGSVYQFIGDVLFEQFRDEDFADLYPKDGQPSISPVLLSFVTIFQALEDLSDRQTVYCLRFRFDWKYALHLEPGYKGFDHTVLSEFRQRLLRHGAESRVFTAIFAQLKQLGFYKHKGIQRTDSLAIYTHHRLLKRIELCVETMRVCIKHLLHHAPEWTRATLPLAWEERYAKRCKSERMSEEERQALAVVVGDDGQWLLDRLEQEDAADLRELRAVATLRDVWAVHYERGPDSHMHWKDGGERGGSHAIETPYDPDARWATKRSTDWVGYKLHVTETDEADMPHLITDIALTPAPPHDTSALSAIRERQQHNDTLPGERYVDSGYVSGENIADGQTLGEELLGPIRTTVTPQSKLPDGFSHADFLIDFALKLVTCPNGQTAPIERSGTQGTQATFRAATCRDCPLRARCCTGKKEGRTLRFGPHYQETQAARKRQLTEEFKQKYRAHRCGVEGCLSALVRGQGIRTTRYDGQSKNHLRALFVGAAVNLARSAAWRAGYRPKKYPPRLGLAVGGGGAGATGAAATALAA
jgi:transposase